MGTRVRVIEFGYDTLDEYEKGQGLPSLQKPESSGPASKPNFRSGYVQFPSFKSDSRSAPLVEKAPEKPLRKEPDFQEPLPPPIKEEPKKSVEKNEPIATEETPSRLKKVSLRPITIRPQIAEPRYIPKLSQKSLEPTFVPPTRKPVIENDDEDGALKRAKETLKRLHQEEKTELEAKNAALSKKNQELKTTNGKLGLNYIIAAIELSRLNAEPKDSPRNQPSASPEPIQSIPDPQSLEKEIRNLKHEKSDLQRKLDDSLMANESLQDKLDTEKQRLKALSVNPKISQSQIDQLKYEDMDKLRRENKNLREKISELTVLKDELSNLRYKLEEYESNSQDENLAKLRKDNKDLKSKLEGAKSKNSDDYNRLVNDKERLQEAMEKELKLITSLDYEVKRLKSENEAIKHEAGKSHQALMRQIEALQNKLAKRDNVKNELEKVMSELHRYRKNKEEEDEEMNQKHGDILKQNEKLRDELGNMASELETLKKLYVEQNKKPAKSPTPRESPSRRNSSSSSAYPEMLIVASPKQKIGDNSDLVKQFLLGLEVYRLNFAYLNCRCPEVCSDVCQMQRTRSRLSLRCQDRIRMMSNGTTRDSSPNGTFYPESYYNILQERDYYKDKLQIVEGKSYPNKEIQSPVKNKPNPNWVAFNPSQVENYPQNNQVGSTISQRELELRKKIEAAERNHNARQNRQNVDSRSRYSPRPTAYRS